MKLLLFNVSCIVSFFFLPFHLKFFLQLTSVSPDFRFDFDRFGLVCWCLLKEIANGSHMLSQPHI